MSTPRQTEDNLSVRGAGRSRFEFYRILFHVMAMCLIGLALFPATALLYFTWKAMGGAEAWLRVFVFSFLLGPAYFLFGISLMLTGCVLRNILCLGVRPGLYRIYEDREPIRWMGYNAVILVVNACFLDGFRVSPLQTFFYRAMGAKIGNGAEVNTSGLADLEMIEIGSDTIIGGGVTLICHAADRGMLKLSPVKIGSGVTVGLGTIIMPACEIGDGAVIAPRSMLKYGTKIPPKGHFGGDPLRDLRAERQAKRSDPSASPHENNGENESDPRDSA